MKGFRFTSHAGVDFGVYFGKDAEEAYQNFLKDAGAEWNPCGTLSDLIVEEVR